MRKYTWIKYRYHFSFEVDDWEYKLIEIPKGIKWKKYVSTDLKSFLSSEYDYSEHYRGIDIITLSKSSPPKKVIEEEIETRKRKIKSLKEEIKAINKIVKDKK